MAKELRQSSEKLRAVADITRALTVQMDELLKLREAVQKAEEATARGGPSRPLNRQQLNQLMIEPITK
jgi:hypothetical protein